jgi:hypothetical protein
VTAATVAHASIEELLEATFSIRSAPSLYSEHELNNPQLRSKDEAPTRNFFAPLRSTEMEADHGDDAGDSTEDQQEQAPSSQAAPYCTDLSGKPDTIAMATEGLKGNFEFSSTRNGTRIVTKEMTLFSTIPSYFRAITAHYSPSIPKPRGL